MKPQADNFEDRIEILEIMEKLDTEERKINMDHPVYLLTWCPDPKEMIDADFYIQHNVHVSTLSNYLKACACGAFCVEATQRGVPHYHGWYQVNHETEKVRVSIVKTMIRFGRVEIGDAKHIRPGSYSSTRNSLHYYKKDVLDMISEPNPILRDSVSTVDFTTLDMVQFFQGTTIRSRIGVQTHLQQRKHVEAFYADTINYANNTIE